MRQPDRTTHPRPIGQVFTSVPVGTGAPFLFLRTQKATCACRRRRAPSSGAAMARSGPEVADIFCRYGEAYRVQHDASLSTAQLRVMTAIELCRTAALGGHVVVQQDQIEVRIREHLTATESAHGDDREPALDSCPISLPLRLSVDLHAPIRAK